MTIITMEGPHKYSKASVCVRTYVRVCVRLREYVWICGIRATSIGSNKNNTLSVTDVVTMSTTEILC